jgi:Lrp/AsnC family transcriptional regulator for asnA, asnC and gidA
MPKRLSQLRNRATAADRNAENGKPQARLSELDLQIIVALSPDARKSNAQIARELNIAEGTVRRRIQRMMEAGILRVVPVLDPRLLGFGVEVRFDLSVEMGSIEKVGQQFKAMPEVYGVVYCTGARDLSVGALFRSDTELLDFLNTRLPTMPEIQRVLTTHVLKSTKRLRDWWPAIASAHEIPVGEDPATATSSPRELRPRSKRPVKMPGSRP